MLAIVILAVADLERSARFYDSAFGWKRAVTVPVYIEYFVPGGSRVAIYQRDAFAVNTGLAPIACPEGATASAELYFRIGDLEAAIGRIERAGGRLLSARAAREWGDDAAYFADPDGHVIAVARETEEG
jgi:predicted enzyme related to lactoylglutathione lyase